MHATRSREKGEVREDGYVFAQYQIKGDRTYETWLSPAATERRWFSSMWQAAKGRAKEHGLPFDITVDHLMQIYPQDHLCPVTLVEMEKGGRGGRENSPTIDRRIPEQGYVVGNVGFISNRANRLKGGLSLDEMVRLLTHMKGPTDAPAIA